MNRMTSCLYSSVRRAVASSRRRSASSESRSASKTNVCELTDRANRELAQHVEGGRGADALIAAEPRDVDADVLGERALGHSALVAQGG